MSSPQIEQLQRSYRFGIRAKTLTVLLLATLVGLGISGTVYFYASQKASREQAIEHLKTATETQADRLENLYEQYFKRLQLLTSRTQLRISLQHLLATPSDTEARERIARILADAANANEDFHALHVFDPSGELLFSVNGEGAFAATLAELPVASMAGADEIRVLEQDGERRLAFSGPLQLDGTSLGYLLVEADLSGVRNIIDAHAGLGESGETIVASPSGDGSFRALAPLRFDEQGTSQLTIEPTGGESLAIHDFIDYRGEAVIAIERALEGSDWIAFVKRDKSEIFSRSRELRQLMIGALIGSFLIVLLLGVYFSDALTRSLLYIASTTRRIAHGDLEHRVHVDRSDEIGDLATSINTMTDSLVEMNAELEDRVKRRTQQLHDAHDHLEILNAELEKLARKDELTGIANRRMFEETFLQEWLRASREAKPLGLMLIDVDHFKRFNDCGGHEVGDRALAHVARLLQGRTARAADLLARYGGEEFAVIAPDTNLDGMRQFAEQLRMIVEQDAYLHPAPEIDTLSVSIGAASIIPEPGADRAKLFAQADSALYLAKQQGRNRVFAL